MSRQPFTQNGSESDNISIELSDIVTAEPSAADANLLGLPEDSHSISDDQVEAKNAAPLAPEAGDSAAGGKEDASSNKENIIECIKRLAKTPHAITLSGQVHKIPTGKDPESTAPDPNNPVTATLPFWVASLLPSVAALTVSLLSWYPVFMFGCRGMPITAEMDSTTNALSTTISWVANLLLTTQSVARSFQLIMALLGNIVKLCNQGERAEASIEIFGMLIAAGLATISLLPFEFLVLEMGSPEQVEGLELIANGTAPYNMTNDFDRELAQACVDFFSPDAFPSRSTLSALAFGLMFYGASHSLVRGFFTHIKRLVSSSRQAPHFSESIWSTISFLAQLGMVLGFADRRNTSPSTDENSFFAYFKPAQMLTFSLLWPLMMRVGNSFKNQEKRRPRNWLYQIIINLFNANNLLGLIPLVALAIFQLEESATASNDATQTTSFPATTATPSSENGNATALLQTLTVASLAVYASFIQSIIEGPVKDLLWMPAYTLTEAAKALFRACCKKANLLQQDQTEEDPRLTLAKLLYRIPTFGGAAVLVYLTTFAAVQNTKEDAAKSHLSAFWTDYSIFIAILGGLTFNLPEIARVIFGDAVDALDKRLEKSKCTQTIRKAIEEKPSYDEKYPLFRQLVAKKGSKELKLIKVKPLPTKNAPAFLSMGTESCSKSSGKNCAASFFTYLASVVAALLGINVSYMGARKLMGLGSFDPEQYNTPSDMAAWFCAIFMTAIMFQGMACFTNHSLDAQPSAADLNDEEDPQNRMLAVATASAADTPDREKGLSSSIKASTEAIAGETKEAVLAISSAGSKEDSPKEAKAENNDDAFTAIMSTYEDSSSTPSKRSPHVNHSILNFPSKANENCLHSKLDFEL